MDMHEPLITRGPVQKSEWAYLIFHPCNTVLVHHYCHMNMIGTGGDEMFERCARQLVQYEGHQRVREYLVSMCEFFPTIAKQALQRFDAIKF